MNSVSDTNLEPQAGCIASAMTVLGQKWTALILRDLMSGPKRFTELERSVNKITPRTLSQRLCALETQDIIYSERPGLYALTSKGADLLPILKQMATWGTRHPS